MKNLKHVLQYQTKKIYSRIASRITSWFSSRSSGVLPAPVLFQVDVRGLSWQVMWFHDPASLEWWGQGLEAVFGLRDWIKSNRDVSYLLVLEGLLWRHGLAGAHHRDGVLPAAVLEGSPWHKLSWRSPSTLPKSLQILGLGDPGSNNQQGWTATLWFS